jgi:hypothetical protein
MSHGPSALPLALLLLSLHVTPSILLPRRFPCIVPTRPKLYCPSLAKQRPLRLPKPPYLYAFFLLGWARRCSPNRSFSAFTNARASHNSFICFFLPTNPSAKHDVEITGLIGTLPPSFLSFISVLIRPPEPIYSARANLSSPICAATMRIHTMHPHLAFKLSSRPSARFRGTFLRCLRASLATSLPCAQTRKYTSESSRNSTNIVRLCRVFKAANEHAYSLQHLLGQRRQCGL